MKRENKIKSTVNDLDKKDLEPVMSYNMDNTCWPHILHMVD